MLRQNWPATFGFAVFGVLAVIAAAILLTSTSTDAYLISGALLALAVGQASAALVQDGRFRALDQQELERGRSQHDHWIDHWFVWYRANQRADQRGRGDDDGEL